MIDLPIMRNHQSPPPSPPPDSILKRDALEIVLWEMLQERVIER
jgi:hypothetical protein